MTGPTTLALLLRMAYPRRSTVSPAEIASVLIDLKPEQRGEHVGAIEKAQGDGKPLPGLRQAGGLWRLPIEALAGLASEPVEAPPRKRRSKHSTIGPRLLLQRQRGREALQAVLDAFDAELAEEQARAIEAATTSPQGLPRRQGIGRL